MTADAFCLICTRPLVYFNDRGWVHTQKVFRKHRPEPDRGV